MFHNIHVYLLWGLRSLWRCCYNRSLQFYWAYNHFESWSSISNLPGTFSFSIHITEDNPLISLHSSSPSTIYSHSLIYHFCNAKGNGLISITGSKTNVTGHEHPQLRTATACGPTFLYVYCSQMCLNCFRTNKFYIPASNYENLDKLQITTMCIHVKNITYKI